MSYEGARDEAGLLPILFVVAILAGLIGFVLGGVAWHRLLAPEAARWKSVAAEWRTTAERNEKTALSWRAQYEAAQQMARSCQGQI